MVSVRRDGDRLKHFAVRTEFTDRHGVSVAVWDSPDVVAGPDGHRTVPAVCIFLRGEAPSDNTGFARLDWSQALRLRAALDDFLAEWSG